MQVFIDFISICILVYVISQNKSHFYVRYLWEQAVKAEPEMPKE